MKITVPTSWEDVSIPQFIELSKVKDLGFDEMDTSLRILSILTGVEDDKLLGVPLSEIKRLSKKTDFIKDQRSFKELNFDYKLGGHRFRFEWDAAMLRAGEYIDIQNYLKGNPNDNIHNIIATYLKPVNIFGFIKKEYYKKTVDGSWVQTLESRNRTAKLVLEEMNMSDVLAMNGFFLNRWKKLTLATKDYLNKQNKKAMKSLKRELAEAGLPTSTDGI